MESPKIDTVTVSPEVAAVMTRCEPGPLRPRTELDIIAEAAVNPNVDVAKLRELLEMRKEVRALEAEIQFNESMKAAQEEMLPIVRDAENQHTRSRYAKLETIDKKIRPIYTKHGFSLSFNTGEPRTVGAVRMLCEVRHIAGHKKPYELEGELDTAGAKGTSNKTSIQGLGSTVSYLRRYLTLMIFNLTLANEDNDGEGSAGGCLSNDQVETITDMVNACGMTGKAVELFLRLADAPSIETIQARRYDDLMTLLRAKLSRRQGE